MKAFGIFVGRFADDIYLVVIKFETGIIN